jgi:hypothetical protein
MTAHTLTHTCTHTCTYTHMYTHTHSLTYIQAAPYLASPAAFTDGRPFLAEQSQFEAVQVRLLFYVFVQKDCQVGGRTCGQG